MSPAVVSEETPLLREESHVADVYDRFSPSQKLTIQLLVSGCGLLPFIATGTFTPSILKIAHDLNTTPAIVSLAISLSMFAGSLGGLIGAANSSFYGRRPVYLVALGALSLTSFTVAWANSVPSLLFWRLMQALCAAPCMVVGSSAIGDIYRLEERGRGMGAFFAVCLIGPSLAPFVGGTIAEYYSWRVMQAVIGVGSIFVLILLYYFLPETSHPGTRGIDKLIEADPSQPIPLKFINPFRPLALLKSPVLMVIGIVTSSSMLSYFTMIIPMVFTMGVRYNITNTSVLGMCFVPSGIGNIVGAILVGRLSDRIVIRWKARRGGIWCPEDRLRASLSGYIFIIPASLMAFAFVNVFVDGKLGFILCLIIIFIHGVGCDIGFGPCAAYLIDVMQSRGVESLAANNALRAVLTAAGTGTLLPATETYGVMTTFTLISLLNFGALGALLYLIRNGEKLRAMKDVGFAQTPR